MTTEEAHAPRGGGRLRRARQWVRQTWWAWELLAAIVAVSAFSGLIVLLCATDQRPVPTWTVGGTQLTPNALVAALATVMRASLLLVVAGALNQNAWNWFAATKDATHPFDGHPLEDFETFSEAAANSLSSAKLLYRTKGRYLASMGALVMILSIASDPLVQQILNIETNVVDVVLPATNVSTENILPHMRTFYRRGYGPAIVDRGRDMKMEMEMEYSPIKMAIESSMFGMNTSLPSAACPTGECKWPVTPTLGVCSRCTEFQPLTRTWSGPDTEYQTNTTCDYTEFGIPPPPLDELTFDIGLQPPPVVQIIECRNVPKDMNVPSNSSVWKLVTGYSPDFVPHPTTIATLYTFGTLKPDLNSTARDWGVTSSPLFGYNCTLYFCVQGFHAAAIAGRVTSEPIAAVAEGPLKIGAPGYNKSSVEGLEFGEFSEAFMLFRDIPDQLNDGNLAPFNVTAIAKAQFGSALRSIFNGSMEKSHGRGTVYHNLVDPIPAVLWTSSDSLTNFSRQVKSVADTLTSYLRTHPGDDPYVAPSAADPYYAPTVGIPTPFVRVSWAWFAYPLTLLVTGLVFFVLTICATRRRRVRPWKGHRVPLLLASLDESLRAQAQGGLAQRCGLKDRVGEAYVRLEFDGHDGIVFRRIDKENEGLRSASDSSVD